MAKTDLRVHHELKLMIWNYYQHQMIKTPTKVNKINYSRKSSSSCIWRSVNWRIPATSASLTSRAIKSQLMSIYWHRGCTLYKESLRQGQNLASLEKNLCRCCDPKLSEPSADFHYEARTFREESMSKHSYWRLELKMYVSRLILK